MSKETRVGNYEVTYLEDFERIFVYPPEVGLQSGLTKHDLLDMLQLFQEQEQENE